MNQKELQLLIATRQVASVVLSDSGDGYEVWAYPDDFGGGSDTFPTGLGNRLRETARGGKPRTWQDVTRGIRYLRKLGWVGPVTVEDSVRHDSD